MKLNLKYIAPEIKKPAPAKPVSPIGWWSVTTEGDEEGRSTTQLGTHYGHVAEIAFSLADKCYYALEFKPVDAAPPQTRPTYTCNKLGVWIRFNIYGSNLPKNLDEHNGQTLNEAVREFLDCPEYIVVSVTDGVARYYRSCFLRFVPQDGEF
jgi:hypothetical protein